MTCVSLVQTEFADLRNALFLFFCDSQPKATTGTKKAAPAPYSKGGKGASKAPKDPRFEKRSKSFGIGECCSSGARLNMVLGMHANPRASLSSRRAVPDF